MKLDPGSVMSYYNMASASHALDRRDAAVKWFRKTIELDPLCLCRAEIASR